MAKEEAKPPAEVKGKRDPKAGAPAKPAAPSKAAVKGAPGKPPEKGKVGEKGKLEAPAKPKARVIPRLLERFRSEIRPTLLREFRYKNVMQVPKVSKVVVNVGVGEALTNAKALDAAVRDLSLITGQKPLVQKAKKSIATFKLRAGQSIGVKVTLRGDRMYSFLDRLMSAALPRQRDFRGVPRDAFDGRGNYTLGLREQLVWPEIDYDQIDKVRGMEITIVTTAQNDEEGRRLLQLLGMPFRTS